MYRGARALPFAIEALQSMRVVYATNNASRSAAVVAAALAELGLADPLVVTSADAGASLLASRLGPGAMVLAVGGEGVADALARNGLTPTRDRRDRPTAVLQGWGRAVTVDDLAAAAIVVAEGGLWCATNTDRTLPTEAGIVPGNGTLIAAVETAAGRAPDLVAGKPSAPLYRAAAERFDPPAARLLAVGDRLDTDIAGAASAGLDSMWVLGGVDRLVDLARSSLVPTYTARDLRALHAAYPTTRRDQHSWQADTDQIVVQGTEVRHLGDGPAVAALAAQVVLDLRDELDRGQVVEVAEALDEVIAASGQ